MLQGKTLQEWVQKPKISYSQKTAKLTYSCIHNNIHVLHRADATMSLYSFDCKSKLWRTWCQHHHSTLRSRQQMPLHTPHSTGAILAKWVASFIASNVVHAEPTVQAALMAESLIYRPGWKRETSQTAVHILSYPTCDLRHTLRENSKARHQPRSNRDCKIP